MFQRSKDIVIIGGGVIGCSIAYYLAKKGVKPLIIERKEIASEASCAAAGGLWPQSESNGPGVFLDLCLESKKMFPALSRELEWDISFDPAGLLHLIEDEKAMEESEKLLNWQKKRGLQVEFLSREETLKKESALSPDILGSLYFENDDQLSTIDLSHAFYLEAIRLGAEVMQNTEVKGINLKKGRVEGVVIERKGSKKEIIQTKIVVNAAGAWSKIIGEMVGLRIPVSPMKGQIVLTDPLPTLFRCSLVAQDVYMMQKSSMNVVLGSTREDVGYNKTVTPEGIEKLRSAACNVIPRLKNAVMVRTWAGLRPYTQDEVPIFGRVDEVEGFIMACGHFRNGILLSPVTGKLIAELIIDKKTSFPLEGTRLSRFEDYLIKDKKAV
jgi:glycine oxidase